MGTNFDIDDPAEFSNFELDSDGNIFVNFNGKRLKIRGAFISDLNIESQINEPLFYHSERIFTPSRNSLPTFTMKCESFEVIGEAEYTKSANPIWSNVFN